METQTKTITLTNPTAQSIYEELQAAGYKVNVNKRQYAEIIGCSVSGVDNYIAKGYGVPNYRKIGHQRNARVLFSLRDVAEYLAAQTVVTV
ncbi:hypothetical protein ACLHDG_06740 [Sulfurovum sp. CS9]|uniref:hypothetical protein n=1 Tax=Sulfurovum sp. CS9 TaxID=3391146 RepID=UPI0039EA351B